MRARDLSQEPSGSRVELSLDFNPRDLAPNWVPSDAAEREPSLDAIYVPTKGRPHQVNSLLQQFKEDGIPVYLLPSSSEDLPSLDTLQQLPVEVYNLLLQSGSTALSLTHSLRSSSNPIFTISARSWDLPIKRNYALWHAGANRFQKILLVDDDIRGFTGTFLQSGAAALQSYPVAGFFVDDFPDTSVIGHVEIASGEQVHTFLSGSCLFLRCDTPMGFFPQIYNEDWIFMAPHIASGRVCSLGSIRQEAYDPFSDRLLAAFQEPGEIIADGLFALISSGHYGDRFKESVWNTLLSMRREWLSILAERSIAPLEREAVETAFDLCGRIKACDCVGYVADLEFDRQRWASGLKELR